ncbi:MAG: RNA methyltransferase [Ignavibacteriae bacterium]|nr:MAG: RNA methyltransferase [Ignavibacteriota bacterium]
MEGGAAIAPRQGCGCHFVSPRLFFYISAVNATQSEIKYLRSLQQKKYREEERKFLLEGWRPLQDALESEYCIEMIAVLPGANKISEHQSMLARARNRNIPVKELKEVQLKQVSDEVHSQGVVALVQQRREVFEVSHLQFSKFIVACDSVSDPGNLGTILRTCDWFGVDAVLLGGGCASLYNEKVVRATAGSIFHLNVFENLELSAALSDLHSEGFRIIASALEGTAYHSFEHPKKTVLVLGSEAHGVEERILKLADEVLRIPRYGKAESLNVGIACGIFLAAWRNQLAGK